MPEGMLNHPSISLSFPILTLRYVHNSLDSLENVNREHTRRLLVISCLTVSILPSLIARWMDSIVSNNVGNSCKNRWASGLVDLLSSNKSPHPLITSWSSFAKLPSRSHCWMLGMEKGGKKFICSEWQRHTCSPDRMVPPDCAEFASVLV
jgi:hypothetical protein